MKISIVVTVFNEKANIANLLESLLVQTKKPDEIVIVDGGSQDKTIEIIKHFQKKEKRIKLLVEKCSRAQGRNLGIDISRNEIVALTDAGCVPNKHWFGRITKPFVNKEVDVVAGFYKMTGETAFQKALSFYLGVLPSQFDTNYLPSTRSVAIKKETWLEVGGFPEKLKGTAEDTVFNYRLVQSGANIARVKNAQVEWGIPRTLRKAFNKIFLYAKGDAQSKIWWHPSKKLSSHNIKVLFVLVRYAFGLVGLILAFSSPLLWFVLLLGLFLYIFWSFRKVYVEFGDYKIGMWGIILQFTSDFAVMSGFLTGIFAREEH
ncbi:glycosyltransferase [Patescibacteria group bacterium]|nr:glycosyltransferase [Patescibacteria group bacterium]MBU0776986.1 glycosyltransferase [Patescibacteria group bacterium]MBU0845592.1 glycosyltransferase [Patescibacteria group bacterium]MBU0923015.1 glycosyltransferase [Patescibacteria group bacterium]MBU1066329.1 glycosyltransferase [Patescibacteria group bacterium]